MEPVRPFQRRTVEFGIYRDGDNNLDASQGITLKQALRASAGDRRIEYTVEDSTSLATERLRTERFTISDGEVGHAEIDGPRDMASEKNLAQFVAGVLDNAEASGARQTWIELTDHGAGDGGGLEADSYKQIMPMPKIAQAIADGVKLHGEAHPEDVGRRLDGVVANQCLMASLGFADALSHAGVGYLAASPETMVSPGVPSDVADAIARHPGNKEAMAQSLVRDVMQERYGAEGQSWHPAAAFDVLDLDPEKMSAVEHTVKDLNDAIAARAGEDREIAALRADAQCNQGMIRFPDATPDMPWHADRPAVALYDTFARDARLDPELRSDASKAARAVKNIIVAHDESTAFEPFGGADYVDAKGPTVHFPVNAAQIDPWAPKVSETHNRFFSETDAAGAESAVT